MIAALEPVTLGAPWWLALLLPLAVLVAARLMTRSAAAPVADIGPAFAAARATWRTRLRRLPDVLRLLAAVLLVLAMARPREGLATTALPEEGIDIVAAVDISSSMTNRLSGSTSRIEAARDVIDEFAGTLHGDRLGLVAFQARALTLSPVTNDVEAIRGRIDQLDPGILPDGTAIGLGLLEAVSLLEDSPARSRVVVLLTDGRNNTGDVEPGAAARVAEALGVKVYTIGLASELSFGLEAIDERALSDLAEVTGGAFFDAKNADELQAAYEEIGSLERSRIGERQFVEYREYGPWLALAASLVLTFDILLRGTVLRRTT